MQPGDAIVAVDGVPTYGLAKEEVYDLIIGSPRTKVNVSIMRSGDFKVYTCTRMDINDLTDPMVRRDYMMAM
jgi:C-terminal processing protease CtpA/Prc